jgi:hypothetical protein
MRNLARLSLLRPLTRRRAVRTLTAEAIAAAEQSGYNRAKAEMASSS